MRTLVGKSISIAPAHVLQMLMIGFVLCCWMDVASAAREVSSKRECATCHIMWLTEFKRKDVTPLIPYDPKPVTSTGKQDVSSTEAMCFSCHDGFVLDSRFKWETEKHAHPIGIKPSKKIHFPTKQGKTIFPLNEDGKVYCGTCHTAHGVDWAEKKDTTIFLRVRNDDSSMCLACHLEKGTGPTEGNHPVIEPLKKHPQQLVKAGSKFGRQGEVICQSCHRPHGSTQERMLVISNKDSALCQTCHDDKKGVVGSKHDLREDFPDKKNIKGKTVVDAGPCSACHVPHAGKPVALWAGENNPESKSRVASLCEGCHRKEGIAKKRTTGTHSHPVDVDIQRLGINVDKGRWKLDGVKEAEQPAVTALPLFKPSGHRDAHAGKVSCPTCHDPHKWSPTRVNTPGNDKGEGDTDSSFLRIAQGHSSELCRNCHVSNGNIVGSKHDLIKATDAGKQTSKDDPKDVCSVCHRVHNAGDRMLRAKKAKPGKTFIQSWCLDCHSKDGKAHEKQLTDKNHPLEVELKPSMSKNILPLFDPDGSQPEHGGKIDCATCHNPHQWSVDKDINALTASDEGNGQNSFLRLPSAEDGQLCTNCHAEKSTVVRSDHDMRVTAPEITNAAGEGVLASGVCGQCHAVHDPVLEDGLWARKLVSNKDIRAEQCLSCHKDKNIAGDKLPSETKHPDDVVVWSAESRKVFSKARASALPVFDEAGHESLAGLITCPTCHEPHRWSAHPEIKPTGKNEEGDAMSSFLRTANSEHIVCADCHGKDGLFRYKYFHGKTSRKKHPLYR